jgi:ribosome-associated protein
MNSIQLSHFLADCLADKKATDITLLDVRDLVGYTDVFVVCTGRSDRLVKALADHVERQARTELRLHPIGVEGAERGLWALLDFGDVVVHIFREHERVFYDLEGLWEDAPRVPYEPPAPTAATGT